MCDVAWSRFPDVGPFDRSTLHLGRFLSKSMALNSVRAKGKRCATANGGAAASRP